MHEFSLPGAYERAVKAANSRDPNKTRGIDPTTAELEYSADQVEFAMAMDAYKQKTGRKFPACHEVLSVLQSLGYQKIGLNA